MLEGYLKLWRCSMESRVWQNVGLWQTWCWCLMKASYKERWVSIKTGKGETEVFLKPGQFVFGRKTAAKALKVNTSTIRNRMAKLKSMKNVDIQPYSHYSIVSIRNWGAFQSDENVTMTVIGQAGDNQRTGKGQAEDTNKKVNKDKKVNNKTFSSDSNEFRLSNLLLSKILLRNPEHKKPDLQGWAKEVDYMIRLDNRDPQKIANLIDWVQTDTFWQNNVLCTKTLRAKYDDLFLKMGGATTNPKEQGSTTMGAEETRKMMDSW